MDANLMDYNNMIDTLLLMKKEYINLGIMNWNLNFFST